LTCMRAGISSQRSSRRKSAVMTVLHLRHPELVSGSILRR